MVPSSLGSLEICFIRDHKLLNSLVFCSSTADLFIWMNIMIPIAWILLGFVTEFAGFTQVESIGRFASHCSLRPASVTRGKRFRFRL